MGTCHGGIHSWGTNFGTKDFVALDLNVHHDLLLFNQSIYMYKPKVMAHM